MEWIGYGLPLITIIVAIIVGKHASSLLQDYERSDGEPHVVRAAMARRYRRWRRAAHVAATVSLAPIILLDLSLVVESLVARLRAAFGAIGVGALMIVVLKLQKKLVVKNAYRADVSLWNQITLSMSGLTMASVAYLCWVVLQRPSEVKEAIKIILGLK